MPLTKSELDELLKFLCDKRRYPKENESAFSLYSQILYGATLHDLHQMTIAHIALNPAAIDGGSEPQREFADAARRTKDFLTDKNDALAKKIMRSLQTEYCSQTLHNDFLKLAKEINSDYKKSFKTSEAMFCRIDLLLCYLASLFGIPSIEAAFNYDYRRIKVYSALNSTALENLPSDITLGCTLAELVWDIPYHPLQSILSKLFTIAAETNKGASHSAKAARCYFSFIARVPEELTPSLLAIKGRFESFRSNSQNESIIINFYEACTYVQYLSKSKIKDLKVIKEVEEKLENVFKEHEKNLKRKDMLAKMLAEVYCDHACSLPAGSDEANAYLNKAETLFYPLAALVKLKHSTNPVDPNDHRIWQFFVNAAVSFDNKVVYLKKYGFWETIQSAFKERISDPKLEILPVLADGYCSAEHSIWVRPLLEQARLVYLQKLSHFAWDTDPTARTLYKYATLNGKHDEKPVKGEQRPIFNFLRWDAERDDLPRAIESLWKAYVATFVALDASTDEKRMNLFHCMQYAAKFKVGNPTEKTQKAICLAKIFVCLFYYLLSEDKKSFYQSLHQRIFEEIQKNHQQFSAAIADAKALLKLMPLIQQEQLTLPLRILGLLQTPNQQQEFKADTSVSDAPIERQRKQRDVLIAEQKYLKQQLSIKQADSTLNSETAFDYFCNLDIPPIYKMQRLAKMDLFNNVLSAVDKRGIPNYTVLLGDAYAHSITIGDILLKKINQRLNFPLELPMPLTITFWQAPARQAYYAEYFYKRAAFAGGENFVERLFECYMNRSGGLMSFVQRLLKAYQVSNNSEFAPKINKVVLHGLQLVAQFRSSVFQEEQTICLAKIYLNYFNHLQNIDLTEEITTTQLFDGALKVADYYMPANLKAKFIDWKRTINRIKPEASVDNDTEKLSQEIRQLEGINEILRADLAKLGTAPNGAANASAVPVDQDHLIDVSLR